MATFLRGVYYGGLNRPNVAKDWFMNVYKQAAEKLIAKGTVMVACAAEDPNTIIGYSILSHNFQTIHWVYVKKNFRGHGIGRRLTPENPTTVTHLTEIGQKILPKFEHCTYVPFKPFHEEP
jgi:GNAT superfamily N-acetyltransferase